MIIKKKKKRAKKKKKKKTPRSKLPNYYQIVQYYHPNKNPTIN